MQWLNFQVGAINENEEITALGHHLAALPVDVRIGKVSFMGLNVKLFSVSVVQCIRDSGLCPFIALLKAEFETCASVWIIFFLSIASSSLLRMLFLFY